MRRLNNEEERQAQGIACGHLVSGCEGAVSDLLSATGASKRQSPTQERATEIVAQVLSSWRDALKALRSTKGPGAIPAAGNLDGWTRDELFAEALTRSVADPPALRLMQDVILRALLTAHDRGPPVAHLAS